MQAERKTKSLLNLLFRGAACLMNAVVLRLRVAEICEIGKYAVKLVCAVERRGNVLLCRAIARIGEMPQAEGFGKNQHCSFSNLAGKSLCGCGSTPLALTSHFPYLLRKQRKTLLRFRLLIMIHSSLHRAIAYIALTRRHRGRHCSVAVCG